MANGVTYPLACNKENMRLFVAALRSGEFKQGHNALRLQEVDEDGGAIGFKYCCLGVATELAIRNNVKLVEHDEVRVVTMLAYLEDRRYDLGEALYRPVGWDEESMLWNLNDGYMSPTVMQWLGVTENNPHLVLPTGYAIEITFPVTAAGANDDNQWTFNQIADAFEFTYGLKDEEPEGVPTTE